MDELNSSIVDFERVLVSLAFINLQVEVSKIRSINTVIPSFVYEIYKDRLMIKKNGWNLNSNNCPLVLGVAYFLCLIKYLCLAK